MCTNGIITETVWHKSPPKLQHLSTYLECEVLLFLLRLVRAVSYRTGCESCDNFEASFNAGSALPVQIRIIVASLLNLICFWGRSLLVLLLPPFSLLLEGESVPIELPSRFLFLFLCICSLQKKFFLVNFMFYFFFFCF